MAPRTRHRGLADAEPPRFRCRFARRTGASANAWQTPGWDDERVTARRPASPCGSPIGKRQPPPDRDRRQHLRRSVYAPRHRRLLDHSTTCKRARFRSRERGSVGAHVSRACEMDEQRVPRRQQRQRSRNVTNEQQSEANPRGVGKRKSQPNRSTPKLLSPRTKLGSLRAGPSGPARDPSFSSRPATVPVSRSVAATPRERQRGALASHRQSGRQQAGRRVSHGGKQARVRVGRGARPAAVPEMRTFGDEQA